MAFITATPSGKWRANWRDPAGNQRAKTFRTKREAKTFVAQIETDMAHGSYVSPHSGRVPFHDYAQRWMESWTTERTTAARDESIMRNHVLPQWGDWPLGNIDHMAVQTWVSDLTDSLAHATIVECHRLTSAVLRSAVQNKMIQHNPCEGVRLPKRQKRGQRIMNRTDVLDKLLPVIPEYYKGVVATAAGTGLRWGEIAALCTDAVDLDNATLTVKRTVIEVKGHTSFKAIPKTTAGIRTVPLPSWLVAVISDHVATWPPEEGGLIFPNTVGKPLRRTLFRTRVWKPSLVRAGLLGHLTPTDTGFLAEWTDREGRRVSEWFQSREAAVSHVARRAGDAPTFHDLRHSYATWLVDDGVPVNMVQRVMGHERSSTTLDLYTRRTDGGDRILRALGDT